MDYKISISQIFDYDFTLVSASSSLLDKMHDMDYISSQQYRSVRDTADRRAQSRFIAKKVISHMSPKYAYIYYASEFDDTMVLDFIF